MPRRWALYPAPSNPLRSPYGHVLTTWKAFPPLTGHWTGREGIERHWGPPDPPSVGATTRDEQWTVCPDMIRGGSNGLRPHFTRATISTRRLPQREGSSRSRQSRTGSRRPHRAAISAGSGSTWRPQSLHRTTSRPLGRGGACRAQSVRRVWISRSLIETAARLISGGSRVERVRQDR
jgi:hypothetical protein